MRADECIERCTEAASYVWEVLALPAHARRVAALRLAKRANELELKHTLEMEIDSMRRVVEAVSEVEQQGKETRNGARTTTQLAASLRYRLASQAATESAGTDTKGVGVVRQGAGNEERVTKLAGSVLGIFLSELLAGIVILGVLAIIGCRAVFQSCRTSPHPLLIGLVGVTAFLILTGLVSRNPWLVLGAIVCVAATLAIGIIANRQLPDAPFEFTIPTFKGDSR